jgi:hypothetical protein
VLLKPCFYVQFLALSVGKRDELGETLCIVLFSHEEQKISEGTWFWLATQAVVVVALVEKNSTKTQLSANSAVCSMKNTSFSQSSV